MRVEFRGFGLNWETAGMVIVTGVVLAFLAWWIGG